MSDTSHIEHEFIDQQAAERAARLQALRESNENVRDIHLDSFLQIMEVDPTVSANQNVKGLAAFITQEQAWSDLLIFADALEDAGYTDSAILNTLRGFDQAEPENRMQPLMLLYALADRNPPASILRDHLRATQPEVTIGSYANGMINLLDPNTPIPPTFTEEQKTYLQECRQKEAVVESARHDYITLTVRDLGFTQRPTLQEILDRAKDQFDLDPLTPRDAISFRDRYHQDETEYLAVAMNSILGGDGDLNVFHVNRDSGKSWLSNDWSYPDRHWALGNRFVFARSGK